MTVYLLCLILFLVGLYAVVIKRNLIKIIVGIMVMEYSISLFLVLAGYKSGAGFPVISPGNITEGTKAVNVVDPVSHAVIMTVIMIGLMSLIVLVVMALRLYEKYRTFDITRMKRLKG